MLSELCWAQGAIIMPSKEPKMSKKVAAGKKHISVTFTQKLEITEVAWKWQALQDWYGFIQRCIVYYVAKKQKDQLRLFVASSESVEGTLKQQTLIQPKLMQIDMVLYISILQHCILKENSWLGLWWFAADARKNLKEPWCPWTSS